MYVPKREPKDKNINNNTKEREMIVVQLPRLHWVKRWINVPLSAIELYELQQYFNLEPRDFKGLGYKMKQYILENIRKKLYEKR